VNNFVDVIGEPIDNHSAVIVTNRAAEAGYRRSMFEEFLDDESLTGMHHEMTLAPDGTHLTSKYIPYGA